MKKLKSSGVEKLKSSKPFNLSTFRLFTLSTALLAACSVSAKTFQWRITGNEAHAAQFAAYHGETVAFDLSFSGAASNCTALSIFF